MRRILLVAALAAAVAVAASGPAYSWLTGALSEHRNTGSSSERTSALPIKTLDGAVSKQVVYSQQLDNLALGDLLQVLSEFEVTNDRGYNVGVFSIVILTSSPTGTSGTEVTEWNGRNVTPDMHHDTHVNVGTIEIPSGRTGTQYVNVVAYASSHAASAGESIRVEPDYGRLSVLRWK